MRSLHAYTQAWSRLSALLIHTLCGWKNTKIFWNESNKKAQDFPHFLQHNVHKFSQSWKHFNILTFWIGWRGWVCAQELVGNTPKCQKCIKSRVEYLRQGWCDDITDYELHRHQDLHSKWCNDLTTVCKLFTSGYLFVIFTAVLYFYELFEL